MQRISCDIFCAVVDNLGDAGVCWRLARQLATEQMWAVRLWIDDPVPIDLLAPGHAEMPVEVHKWTGDFTGIDPANVVIEAFACELPPRYVAAMAALPRRPVWLNLEYLSAENWVAGCHGLPSPHPSLPLTKHFFFPGFTVGTGGLLRERDLAVPPVPTFAAGPLAVSLFCYENPVLPALLACWAEGTEPIRCDVAEGFSRLQAERWLHTPFPVGATAQRGNLVLHALPFVPQPAYDAVLAGSHLNFVRGEDSCVRAQWAERPFVWQAYPQAEGTHLVKLDALLGRYCEGLDVVAASAIHAFWQAWNGAGKADDCAAAWPAFRQALPALTTHAPGWASRIAAHGDLATNLVKFCTSRL